MNFDDKLGGANDIGRFRNCYLPLSYGDIQDIVRGDEMMDALVNEFVMIWSLDEELLSSDIVDTYVQSVYDRAAPIFSNSIKGVAAANMKNAVEHALDLFADLCERYHEDRL